MTSRTGEGGGPPKPGRGEVVGRRLHDIRLTVSTLGATSAAVQILLLREFVSVFRGNELVVGILLANWMLLTGAGALCGQFLVRSFPGRLPLRSALLALSILPALAVFLLRMLRNVLFLPGSMIGLVEIVLMSFLIAAPFCLVSGSLFVLCASGVSRGPDRAGITRAYVWESAGSVAGGILFALALASFLDTFQVLALVAAANLGVLFAVGQSHPLTGWQFAGGVFLSLGYAAFVFLVPESVTRRALFPGQEVLYSRDTPYGNLTVTRQQDQLNFFENTVLMFSTNDLTSNEENVHYAMVQRPFPRKVLLIGGGISGTTLEVLKYGVERLDYVEPNPWVVRIGRRFTGAMEDPRLRLVGEDARTYVRSTKERYDVVLVNLPDPSTAQLNRFYTDEFVRDVRTILRQGGVLSVSLLPATEYQGEESRRILSTVYVTLKSVFPDVQIVPGMQNYLLASDTTLDTHFGDLVVLRGVTTAYVNRYYIDDTLLARRSAAVRKGLDTAAARNADFTPVCYYRQVAYWLSYFGFEPGPWIAGAGIAALLFLFWRFSAVDAGMFAGGFTAASVEVLLLVVFQILCGSLYQMTGAVVSAFMAGLAVGAHAARRIFLRPGMTTFVWIQVGVAIFCFVLPAALFWLKDRSEAQVVVETILLLLTFFLACLVGMEFAVASRVRKGAAGTVVARLYGFDLIGSAFGALLASVYLIPLLGVTNTSAVCGAVSAGGAAVCLASRKSYRGPEVNNE